MIGRPAIAEEERRSGTIQIRVNALERLSLNEAARVRGLELSSWIRDTLLKAVSRKKEIGKVEPLPVKIIPRLRPVAQPTRPPGTMPSWYKILEEDAKRIPGKAPK